MLFLALLLVIGTGIWGWHNRRNIRLAINQMGVAHLTRQDFSKTEEKVKNSTDYRVPDAKEDKLLSNIPSAKQYNSKTGQWEPVMAWDSWPVTTPDGTVANYHGYRLTMALTAVGNRSNDIGSKIGLYAQKISDKNTDASSWIYLGNVFSSFGEGKASSKDDCLNQAIGEWSGTTTQMNKSDNTLRMFYTNRYGTNKPGQALTTAKIEIDPKVGDDWKSGLVINHSKASDHKTVFAGDGKYYQTVDQIQFKGDSADSYALRDPHFVADGGKYYLAFEGNTGTETGYQGKNNFSNAKYFGSSSFFKKDVNRLNKKGNETEYNRTYLANATLGKLELNSDFTVKKIMKPMLTANASSDEMERPNLFEYKGKWYLFTCFWGNKMVTNNNYYLGKTYMFGYVSDNGINGTYKPLNGNGLVMQSSFKMNDPRYPYAWLVVKPSKIVNNRFVITSFEGNRTFSPSFMVEINGHSTKMVTNEVLDQGALETTGKTYSATAQPAE
ncbi:glycoside hydrolase family 68 protein [Fructobacillus durionis]|nr:glycoside hydrolase family 68 protein [Fructobacillus durionis]